MHLVWVGVAMLPLLAAPPSPHPREMRFVATAYCRAGRTASGAHTRNAAAAADPRVLPIGTEIRVRGLNRGRYLVYRVLDTGPGVRGRHIDLFMENCAAAKRFGRQRVKVAIVR